jgi:hypothetical protein
LIAFEIEAKGGDRDDVDGSRSEIQPAVLAQALESIAHDGRRILGEIEESGSFFLDPEASEARRATGDREREIQGSPRLAALGMSPANGETTFGQEGID